MNQANPPAAAPPASSFASAALRPPQQVMRLSRMGARYPTRLSFVRSLLRKMAREQWRISRPLFALDDAGFGDAVYRIETPDDVYSLVCFSDPLAAEERSDRVIATKWDTSFTLVHGEIDDAQRAGLRANVPKQEAGRASTRQIVTCRANRSVRLFDAVVDALAAGRQPALDEVARVGYLLRTTAVYGSGKLGMADFERVRQATCFDQPFRHEMLAVYLVREFSLDMVDHIAARRSGERAAKLSPELRRCFGIGNATGLGMAPYLVNHPKLLHQWVWGYENALARVKAVASAGDAERARFARLLARAGRHIAENHSSDRLQLAKHQRLQADLGALQSESEALLDQPEPWRAVADWAAQNADLDGQELINSLLIEVHPELSDDLAEELARDDAMRLEPGMSLAALKALIERHYAWALALDYAAPGAQKWFWYVSEEKLEPRLGERDVEPGAELESPLGIGRDVAALHRHLSGLADAQLARPLVELLIAEPQFRGIARRVQTLAEYPYSEVRDNLLGAEMLPIDLLRFKLASMGAGKYDPKSDRWLRVNFFQGAPLPEQLGAADADDWAFPCLADIVEGR